MQTTYLKDSSSVLASPNSTTNKQQESLEEAADACHLSSDVPNVNHCAVERKEVVQSIVWIELRVHLKSWTSKKHHYKVQSKNTRRGAMSNGNVLITWQAGARHLPSTDDEHRRILNRKNLIKVKSHQFQDPRKSKNQRIRHQNVKLSNSFYFCSLSIKCI